MISIVYFSDTRGADFLEYEGTTKTLMAQVDFCITSTANYLPVIAFEVDSRYHDASDQIVRDEQ